MYIWRRDADYFIHTAFEDKSLVEIRPNLGSLKGKIPGKISVWAKEDIRKIPDFLTCGAMYVVSKKLKEFLESEEVSASVEFLPVEMTAGKKVKKSVAENSFYLMNFLGAVDCFDLDNSIFKRTGEYTVRSVDKVVLDERKIPFETKLFLIFPYILSIGVRDELAEKMLAENFSGVKLAKVEETTFL